MCEGVQTDKFDNKKVLRDRYVEYCMTFVELLLNNGVIPILVFDGRNVPIKERTNKKRNEYVILVVFQCRTREENLQKARQLESEGKVGEAKRYYSAAVRITPEMYIPLINRLIERGVSYIIAPYEADVELAFLARHHLVDFVITQDGDSLVYGCEKVLFKLTSEGKGDEIQYRNVLNASELDIRDFSSEMFMYLCILSGCDYLSNPPNKGMKRLVPFVKRGKTPEGILQCLQNDGGCEITEEWCRLSDVMSSYRCDFRKAINSFHYQVVFDPCTETQTTLSPVPEGFDLSQHTYLGVVEEDPEVVKQLSRLQLHPLTREKMDIIPFPDSYDPLGFLSLKKGETVRPNILGYYSMASLSKSKPRIEKKAERVKEVKEKKGVKSKYFSSSAPLNKEQDLMNYRYKG